MITRFPAHALEGNPNGESSTLILRSAPNAGTNVAHRGAGARHARQSSLFAAATTGIISALVQFGYLRNGGFFLDDFRNLGQARVFGFWHQLITPIGGVHFQPAGRLAIWFVAVPFGESYVTAVVVLSLFVGAAAYALVRLLGELFGPRNLHLVLGLMFGTSWVLLSTNQWFAGADPTFSLFFTIATCLWYVRWHKTKLPRAYVLSILSAMVAVLFWEQAVAIPAWIFLLGVFFLGGSTRRMFLSLVPFVAISLAFTAYVQEQSWHQPLAIPSVSLFVTMTSAMLFWGTFPTTIGTGWQANDTWGMICEIAVPILLVLGFAYLTVRRRLRVEALGFFALGTLVVAATVAATRATIIGDVAGTTGRYITLMPFVLVITLAGLVKDPSTERPKRAGALRIPLIGTAIAICGVLYLVNLTATYHRIWFGHLSGVEATSVADQLGGRIADAHAAPTAWVNTPMPLPIWYPGPGNGLSVVSGYWSRQIQPIGEGTNLVGFDSHGVVRSVRFVPSSQRTSAAGFYVQLTVSAGPPTNLVITANVPKSAVVTSVWVGKGPTTLVFPTWAKQRSIARLEISGDRRVRQTVGSLSFGSVATTDTH